MQAIRIPPVVAAPFFLPSSGEHVPLARCEHCGQIIKPRPPINWKSVGRFLLGVGKVILAVLAIIGAIYLAVAFLVIVLSLADQRSSKS